MCDKRKYQRPTGGKAWEFHTSRRPLPFHDSASIYEAPSHCNTCHYYHIAISVTNITITLHLPSPSWTLYVELRKFITSTVAFGLFINCITCSNTFGNIHGISIQTLKMKMIIPLICHFFTRAKFLESKIYTEKRQFFALNL